MNKKNIVYNHIKKISKSRKVKDTGDCGTCIFNMPTNELASVMGVDSVIITDPCPLTAFVLFAYGFISSDIYATVTNDILSVRKKISAQFLDSLGQDEIEYIVRNVQRHCASCHIGTKQKCYNEKANKV